MGYVSNFGIYWDIISWDVSPMISLFWKPTSPKMFCVSRPEGPESERSQRRPGAMGPQRGG